MPLFCPDPSRVFAQNPPEVVSVSPSSGSGPSQIFSFVYSDANGYWDLAWGQAIINATLSEANSCFLHYNRAPNQLWLQNDTYTGWIGPLTPGTD
ncbi:MAG: hypothetical protein FJW34_21435, partial [Acidobacteria bacterium]|nr:hypothetical protein [Acidobacteriota bacterium]